MKNWKTLFETLTRQKSALRLVLIGAAGLLMLAVAGLFPSGGEAEAAQGTDGIPGRRAAGLGPKPGGGTCRT